MIAPFFYFKVEKWTNRRFEQLRLIPAEVYYLRKDLFVVVWKVRSFSIYTIQSNVTKKYPCPDSAETNSLQFSLRPMVYTTSTKL